MEKLIQKLNQDYYSVFATLDKVKLLGVHSEEGQKFLQKAKLRLQKHLKYEMSAVSPLANRLEGVEARRILRYQQNEIERFLKQTSQYTQRAFLLSIQGRESNRNFAKLLGKFKKNLILEQKLLSREVGEDQPGELKVIDRR